MEDLMYRFSIDCDNYDDLKTIKEKLSVLFKNNLESYIKIRKNLALKIALTDSAKHLIKDINKIPKNISDIDPYTTYFDFFKTSTESKLEKIKESAERIYSKKYKEVINDRFEFDNIYSYKFKDPNDTKTYYGLDITYYFPEELKEITSDDEINIWHIVSSSINGLNLTNVAYSINDYIDTKAKDADFYIVETDLDEEKELS